MFVSYWQNQNALASSLHSVSCSILWAIETNFYTRRKFRAFCCHLDRNCPYPYVILFSTCETSNGPSRVIKPTWRRLRREKIELTKGRAKQTENTLMKRL